MQQQDEYEGQEALARLTKTMSSGGLEGRHVLTVK